MASGHSLEEVAAELMCSPAKVSRIETGDRGIQPRDVRDLSRFYGLSATVQTELLDLADEAARRGWWQSLKSLPQQTSELIGLESAAVEARMWSPSVIPGLLQTAEYTAQLTERLRPQGFWSPEVQAELVESRQRRQDRVRDGSLTLLAIVDEVAFWRAAGSPAVMQRQIQHLITAGDLPNVTLHVIPRESGVHSGVDGGFEWMRFPPKSIADVVYVEGHLGLYFLDKPSDTERYRELFEDMIARYTLSPEASQAWLVSRVSREDLT